MIRYVVIILFIFVGTKVNGQSDISETLLINIDKLVLNNHLKEADSIMQTINDNINSQSINKQYLYHKAKSNFYYKQQTLPKAIEELKKSLELLDSLKQWDCEEYLQMAFHLSSAYYQCNKIKECKKTINECLVKCSDVYNCCPNTKGMYYLLLGIYDKEENSTNLIDNTIDEILKININLFVSDKPKYEASKIKEDLEFLTLGSSKEIYNKYYSRGYLFAQFHDYKLAQYCFEICNTYLDDNISIEKREEKKELVLIHLILNGISIEDYNKVVNYCNEYENYYKKDDYESFWTLHWNRGLSYSSLRKHDKTIEDLNKLSDYILKNNKTNSEDCVAVYRLLGYSYINLNKLDEAIKYFELALNYYNQIDSKNESLFIAINHGLGEAYFKKGNNGKAKSFFQNAISVEKKLFGRIGDATKKYWVLLHNK